MYAFRLDKIPSAQKILEGIQKIINEAVKDGNSPQNKIVVVKIMNTTDYNPIPKLEYKNHE